MFRFKKGWLSLAGFALLMTSVFYGCPYLMSVAGNNYRKKIKQNGIETKAVLFRKNTHKGKFVYFKYRFKDKEYKNHEKSDIFFQELNIDDTISILLDSSDPSASYIIK